MADITPNLFRYSLTYENNKKELIYAPEGWDDESIAGYKRDLKYFGLIRSYAVPLRFVYDGKDILRQAFFKYGVEAGVRLEVEYRQNDWTYKTIFKSDLDFSTYDYDGDHVTIEILEGGISRNIKVNENIKFEYKLTGPDVVNIILPGVQFEDYAIFVPKYVDGTDLNGAKKYVVGIDQTTPFSSNFLLGFNTLQRNASDNDNFNNDAFVRGNRAGGVTTKFTGYFKGYAIRPPNSAQRTVSLEFRSTTNKTLSIPIVSKTPGIAPDFFEVNFDFNYTINKDEGFYLYSKSNNNSSAAYLIVTEGEFKLSFATKSDPSNCKGLPAYSLFNRILNRISPGTQINSQLIKSNYKNLIFTSGTAIRELLNPTIQISWNDFFETFKGLDDAAFGLENNIARLEMGPFFARYAQIFDVGNVNECNITVAEELMFNAIKMGYNDGNTDDKDGREEYNSSQSWKLPFTTIDKEENAISQTRADQFGIEQTRVQFNIKNRGTADTKSDNDTFMIDCDDPDGESNYKPILGITYSNVSGLSYPLTAYNLRLTPKKNLLRKAPYLRSILDKQEDRFIEFASAEKNAELSTTDNGFTVKENQSILVSSLQGKYFTPYFATIRVKLPNFGTQIIDNTPFGYIKFNFNDEEYLGYIFDLNIDLAKNTEREIKLLLLDLPNGQLPPLNPVPVTYDNDAMSVNFTKQCTPPAIGSVVAFNVPAGMFTDSTKAVANQQTIDYINANGQNYADNNGVCTIPNSNSNLYYCFSAINTLNGATMYNIQNNNPVASGYARCLRAIGSNSSTQVGVDPNVILKVNLASGTQNVQVGQIANPNFYPLSNLVIPANDSSSQPTTIVQTDGKIFAQTSSNFIGYNDVVVELPYSFNFIAPWYTQSSFICNDCEIVYDNQNNIISNTCGNIYI